MHYKAAANLRLATTYTYGGKKNGSCALGVAYSCNKNTMLKAKVEQELAF